MRKRSPYHKAEAHLWAAHPVFAALIEKVGPCTLAPQTDGFRALVRTVVAQQISSKAAASISLRLEGLFPRGLTARAILKASDETLRSAGLSRPKQRALRAVAERVVSGQLDFGRLAGASEAEIAEALLPIPGIGPWSVHMYSIFCLGKLDVLPVGDLGVRIAVRDLFGLAALPGPKEIEAMAVAWRPYCTVAAWYLWRSRGFVPQSGVKVPE
jgi:3-methyladenine DNA glycosylase/8-oxoguanine DNA glycosylase